MKQEYQFEIVDKTKVWESNPLKQGLKHILQSNDVKLNMGLRE